MFPVGLRFVFFALREFCFLAETSLAVTDAVEVKTNSQVFVLNAGQTFELQCEIQWSQKARKVSDVATYFLKQQGPDIVRVNIADEIMQPFQETGRMKVTWDLKESSLFMVLSISNMSHEDSGNYTCVAEDQVSSRKATRITHHLFVRAVPWSISVSLSYTLNGALEPTFTNLSTLFYEQPNSRQKVKNVQRINNLDKNNDERWLGSLTETSTSRPIKRSIYQLQAATRRQSHTRNKPTSSGVPIHLGRLRFLTRFPTRVYCSSLGGYPIPEISIYFKDKLISKNIYRRSSDVNKLSLPSDKLISSTHKSSSFNVSIPSLHHSVSSSKVSRHSRDDNESYSETRMIFHGRHGLKTVETQVVAFSLPLYLTPEDDGSIVTCHVTVPGLKSNVTKRQTVVFHPPIVSCNSTEVSMGDKEAVIGCLVRSRPDLSSVYWHEEPSHESGNGSTVEQNYDCNGDYEGKQKCNRTSSLDDESRRLRYPAIFSPEGMHNTIRVLENGSLLAQLHLKSLQKQHFRKFFLTAENVLGSETSSAEFVEKRSVPDTSMAQTSKAFEGVWRCYLLFLITFEFLINVINLMSFD